MSKTKAALAAKPNAGASDAAKSSKSAVQEAFALGWHLAELIHMNPDKPFEDPPLGLLPQVRNLEFADRVSLLVRQINQETVRLGLQPKSAKELDEGQVLTEIGTTTPSGASTPGDQRAEPLSYLRPRHVDVLTRLSAAAYDTGKAYSLGVALGETVIMGYKAAKAGDSVADADLLVLYSEARIQTLVGQIRDLKSSFAPYVAEPVVTTLEDWGTWIRTTISNRAADQSPKPSGFWIAIANSDLYPQGQVWRALLSGEKLATDMLRVGDYVEAIRHLVSTYLEVAKGMVSKPLVAGLFVAVLVLSVLTVILAITHAASAAITSVLAILGVFGVTGATVTAAVRKALAQAEGNLWDAELAAAIAQAIDRVPSSPSSSAVSRLRSSTTTRPRTPETAQETAK